MKGEYVHAVKTRGQCKKDCRYKILDIIEKGTIWSDWSWLAHIEYTEDAYYIMHNNNMSISNSSNFKYDYKYNRKIKLKKNK